MKKSFKTKLLALTLMLSTGLALTGCGNMQIIDTTYTYNYAQTKLPDGTMIEGELLKWSDYEGEQLQLTMADGNVYLVSSFNTVLSVSDIRESDSREEVTNENVEEIQYESEAE